MRLAQVVDNGALQEKNHIVYKMTCASRHHIVYVASALC
jgi:hypothetical protein